MDGIRFLYHQAKPALEAETFAFSDAREKTQSHAVLWLDCYSHANLGY